MAKSDKKTAQSKKAEIEKELTTPIESQLIDPDKLVASLVNSQLDTIKELERPWHKLSEAEQDRIIQKLDFDTKKLIRHSITILESGIERVVVSAGVDQVVFKDGVKIVLKVPAHEEKRHELADAQGHIVKIVLIEENDTLNSDGLPTAEPDQNNLNLEQGDGMKAQANIDDFEEGLKKDIKDHKQKDPKVIDGRS